MKSSKGQDAKRVGEKVEVRLWGKRSKLGRGAKKKKNKIILASMEYYYLDLSRRTKAAYFVLEREERAWIYNGVG